MIHEEIHHEISMTGTSTTLMVLLAQHYPHLDLTALKITEIPGGKFGYGYKVDLGAAQYYLKFDTTYRPDDSAHRFYRQTISELRAYIHEEHATGRLPIDSTILIPTASGALWSSIGEGPFAGSAMTLEPYINNTITLLPVCPTEGEPDRWSSHDFESIKAAAQSHVAFIKAARAFEKKKQMESPTFIFPKSSPPDSFDAREMIGKIRLKVEELGAVDSNILVFIEALIRFLAIYERSSALREMPVHGDFHFGNLLRREDGTYIPIDLDFSTRGSLCHEVMFYGLYDIVRGCLLSGQTIEESLKNPALRVVLDIYDQAFQLTPEEIGSFKYIRLCAWEYKVMLNKFYKDPTGSLPRLPEWIDKLNTGLKINDTPWPDLNPVLIKLREKREGTLARHGVQVVFNPFKENLFLSGERLTISSVRGCLHPSV